MMLSELNDGSVETGDENEDDSDNDDNDDENCNMRGYDDEPNRLTN